MKPSLLDLLIKRYQEYVNDTGKNTGDDLDDFTRWIAQSGRSANKSIAHQKNKSQRSEGTEFLAGKISRALGRLGRFAINYSKKALEDTAFRNVNDFIYLLHLLEKDSMSKTELIHENVQEITTGVDIIKRLLRQELAKQFDDPDDARSKRLKITAKGRKELQKAFPKMQIASKVVLGNLEKEELEQLVNLLTKLDQFHEIIYLKDRELNLSEINAKYISE